MSESDDRQHQEILLLYELAIDDIERDKQWAWQVTFRANVVQGAILALYTTYVSESTSTPIRLVFAALVVVVTLVATKSISDSVKALDRVRTRAMRLLNEFQPKAREFMEPRSDNPTWPFVLYIWASCVVVLVLLASYAPAAQP